MAAWNKFLLLMWKNWKLQRRRPISFLIELAIPLFIVSVFIVIRIHVKKKSYPVRFYEPFIVDAPNLESIRAYSPDDNKFIKELMSSFENAEPFADGKKMEEYLTGPNFENMSDYSLIGLQFEQQAQQEFPKNIAITIRCGSKYVDWHTGELYPPFSLGLRNRESSTGGDPSYRSNFIQLMYLMTQKLLNKSGKGVKLPDMYLQRFPNPAYTNDDFLNTFSQGSLFAFFFMSAFVYACTNMTKSITNEKEKQLKISMKIMGLPTWLHWTAWFCKMMVPFLIIAIVMVVMMKWETAMGAVFEHTNWLLLFIFFLLYVSCIITYSFALSVFFSKANRAASIAGVLWVISLIPYLIIRRGNYEKSSKSLKYLSSLSVTTAMAYGFDIITIYEVQSEGVHWDNLFSTNDQLNITFGGVLLMMCFDLFLYLLIALYVEAIYPGEFGVPQKWYFFLTRNFWYKNIREDDETLLSGINNEYFEEDPRNLKAGVKIRNVWKSFGPNYAVKGINLNIYEDQITVLLGHNGAGKTTTMSMLTGMFPPTRGTAIINGYDVRTQTMAVRDSMGVCPQHNVLFDELTVREHLIFFSRLKGCKGVEVNREVEKYLKLLNLEDKANERSSRLSGGMKRKLCVGIALCGNSKIIILDEPTAGMDPTARRFIWEFLQKQKKDRTILLTTHFMDEADLLGDRIAIMSGGVLQCCGSSFFLKKKYGTGYHLIIEQMPRCNPNNITKVIKNYIPGIEINSNSGTELTYILPENYASKFPHLLEKLETSSSELGIRSFGISLTDLEEVFMKVGAAETGRTLLKDKPTDNKANGLQIPIGIGNSVKGISLYFNQSLAMTLKKILSAKRSWDMELIKIILPVFYIVLVISTDVSINESTTFNMRTFDLKHYTNPVTIVETHDHLQDFYVDFLHGIKQTEELSSNITERMLNLAIALPSSVKYNYIVGASFRNNTAYAWFNNEPYHSVPLSVELLLQAKYKSILGNDYNIDFVNYPLPKNTTRNDRITNSFVFGISTTMTLSLAVAFVGTFYILFNIKERMSQAKHLQFVSGVNVFVFRFVSFFCDLVTFALPCLAILITFAILKPYGMSNAEDLGILALLLFSFGVALMPWMYLFSFFFSIPSTGFSRMFFLSFITGFPFVMIMQVLITVDWGYAPETGWILRVFPHYNIIEAVRVLVNSDFCTYMMEDCLKYLTKTQCENQLCQYGCCGLTVFGLLKNNIIMLYVVGAVCFVFIFLIDFQIITNVIYVVFKRVRRPPKSLENVDSDVMAENDYVHNHSLQEMQSEFAVILRDLTKHYRRITAVNGLNLTVKRSECFGLLGVNGAGKTTTFKMMTGDEMISFGDGWMNGYSIKSEMKKVHRFIGYCPQFDALLDNLTARETLKMFSLIRGVPKDECNFTAEKMSRDFDFTEHLDKEVRQLSGGNKRKLSTAIALVGDAPIIFLDEPTTGMDPATKRHLWNNLTRIRESGKSLILTSHSMEECEALCTRVAIMVNGNFQCLGSTQHLKSKFAEGYSVTLKVRKPENSAGLEHADTTKIEEFITQHFPNGKLREKHQELMTYFIRNENVTWSKLFGILEMAKNLLDIEDYSVGQASLEQVFLTFTKKQQVE